MPRHTQPREVAEARGLIAHNPQRYRNTPPKAAYRLGEPPEHMREEAKRVWFELDTYAAAGVLTCAERPLLEVTANLFADFRDDPSTFPAAKVGTLISALGRLGMSPADRQKLNSAEQPKENPFADF